MSLSRLGDVSEAELLARLAEVYAGCLGPDVVVGPGDDAAVVAGTADVVVTTDSMVRDLDWRDDWSSPHDVGRKVAVGNLADLAAMGARPQALVVSLVADRDLPVDYALDLAAGIAQEARAAGCSVVGGDLSAAPAGVVMVSITALGRLDHPATLRSGAQVGDVVAVQGTLGWSGAGLALLLRGEGERSPELTAYHRVPRTDLAAGVAAARAGAHALIDISDGLVRDLSRVAQASGVLIDLDEAVIDELVATHPYAGCAPSAEVLRVVLGGGEEHSLVGCFAPGSVPAGWWVLGAVVAGSVRAVGESRVLLGGVPCAMAGWDHFAG